ncbi:MAG TPA: COX15/CtaA family protein [Pyrinomonadaceae bacterium]|nr:COX15/CtaA family protein [Pyrinomonadaceae bacterium]
MSRETKFVGFAKYAWFVLAYNIVVILWGVFLRASKSGDGCGQHWLTCGGEVVPSAPELKTVIEFSHRITSALAGLLVIGLVAWAFVIWRKSWTSVTSRALKMAVGSLILVILEGLLGAGLVLTGNTAETLTPERPFWMAAHLMNTLVLLTFLTLTAWYATGGARLVIPSDRSIRLIFAFIIACYLMIGFTGSIAALGGMIFPSESLTEGILKDFTPTSHFLLKLRPLHPIVSVVSAVFLIFAVGWIKARTKRPNVAKWSNIVSVLIATQVAFGAATLLMLAPIVMQIGHLLLADLIWVSLVLLTANYLAIDPDIESDADASD